MSDAPFEKPGLNLLGDKEVAQGLIAESNRRLFQARTLAGIAGVPLFGNRRELPDGSVITTAVFGGQSRVNITGAPPPEKKPIEPEEDLPSGYLLWPTSDQNPDGVLIRDDVPVSPTVLLTLDGTSADVELNMPIEAARDDWLSDDGDGEYGENMLTYQTDSKFRYQFAGYDNSGIGQPVIFVNGIGAYTQHGVRGACMRGDDTVIYASISTNLRTLSFWRFSKPSEPNFIDETLIDTFSPPEMRIFQPVFFSGDGKKFVTVATADLTDENNRPVYHYVRGTVEVAQDGEISLTVSTAPLTLEYSSATTGDTAGWVWEDPQQASAGNGVFHMNSRSIYTREFLVGLDMSVTGDELLVTRRVQSDATHVGAGAQTSGGGVLHMDISQNTEETVSTSIWLNGEALRSIEGTVTTNSSEHQHFTNAFNGTHERFVDTHDSYRDAKLSIREIDARFDMLATLATERQHHSGYSFLDEWVNSSFGHNVRSESWDNPGPLSGELEMTVGDSSWTKDVIDWTPKDYPPGADFANSLRPYRMFASRRKDEIVANVGMATRKKGAANYPDPLAAMCDMTPITVVRNKRADFTLSNEDLGLGDSDTGVTFYSVRMT